jgi:hypothetical protein
MQEATIDLGHGRVWRAWRGKVRRAWQARRGVAWPGLVRRAWQAGPGQEGMAGKAKLSHLEKGVRYVCIVGKGRSVRRLASGVL